MPEPPSGGGEAAVSYPSQGVALMSHLPLNTIGGGTSGSSIYGWVDPQTRREYAIMGRSNGTAFVDVTDPVNPVFVANLPAQNGEATRWREPKVYKNTVYVAVDQGGVGMQVMNLAKLRAYAGTTMTLTADNMYNEVAGIHTLAVNPASGFLYAAGTETYSGGIHAIDARNPLNPVHAGGFADDGYTHEIQVVNYHGPDTDWQNSEIAFASDAFSGGSAKLAIVDVTNKSAMTRIAARTYPGGVFAHQGWLTDDHRYFFLGDEYDENNNVTGGHTRTHVWDMYDLDNPVYKGHVDLATTSIDHNLYVKGDYVFETNYTSGLRIL
ncbi:MAG: choice-of-anchor B family protein, partial [Tepidisphaeraceae bacterium]